MAPILRAGPDRSMVRPAVPEVSGSPSRARAAQRGSSLGDHSCRRGADPLRDLPKELPMPDPISRTYLSLGAFYASNPARRGSRERDVGLFWRSRRGPSYRAAWVQDTGELYLFQHALGGHGGGGSVHLLAPPLDEAELERRLEGWADVCGQQGSLEWLLARMQDPDPVPPKGRFRRALRGP